MDIDSISQIKKNDSLGMLNSIQKLADQIEEIKDQVKKISLPPEYSNFNNIVFMGMGGSSLGSHCIKSIFLNKLKVPLEIINNYEVPGFVDENTLVVCVSYSGGTEETVSGLESAMKKKAKVIAIASGSALARKAARHKIPSLIFTANNNPCGSPRMGLGYTLFGPLFLLQKIGAIKISANELRSIAPTVRCLTAALDPGIPETKNIAKKLAREALVGNVWYIGSGHLSGNVHVAANQMNENAKRFASYYLIPELNHHLLEGLSFTDHDEHLFVFIESSLYTPRVQKRFSVTKSVLKKYNHRFFSYKCTEKTVLSQSLEILVLGSYVSFYAAMLENIDPTAIPTVDYLKKELASK